MRWQPSEAALPCNISDELLEVIARDLDVMLSKHGVNNAPEALPLGLILHILKGQPGDGRPGLLLADLFAAMEDYRLEVTMELKSRRTGNPRIPATMETIFKRRGVNGDAHH